MRNIFLSCLRQKINYYSNGCKIVAPNALFSLSQKLQGVIPVLRHWDLFCKPIGFLHYLLSFQCMTLEPVFFFFWIPVSRAQLYEHCGLRLAGGGHPSSETLGSRKIDRKQAHYTTFSMKLTKNWIPVLRTGMTMSATQITYKSQCSYSCASRAGMTLKGGLLVFHVNNGMQGV